MKNNKLKSWALALLVIVSFTNCESYLDESPDDRLEIDSLEKAAKVVASAYSQASYAFTDMYTDLAGPTGNVDGNGVIQTAGGNNIDDQYLQIYTWDEVDDITQDTPAYYWDRTYTAIAHTNEVLAIIDDLEGDDTYRDAIKGEALLSRAYHHFMLVNLFGLHYDDNASTNLGVPYIVAPETEFLPNYTRNTVAEVYDMVEKDMLEGLTLINDQFFSGTKKYHFTKKAGQAFASRFYLWKRDYMNCKKYSDLFLGGTPSIYVKDYADLDGSEYDDIADNYGDPLDESNVLVMQKYSVHQRRNLGFRLNTLDIFNFFGNILNASDTRLSTGIWNAGTDARYLARLREFFFREDLSANVGQAYHIAVELKGEEVLLNRAESNIFLDNQDAALEDLNTLALKRYDGNQYNDVNAIMTAYGAPNETIAILSVLLDERKKEFWDHGLRWFDIKRYNIPISHLLPVSLGGAEFTLSANDLRKAIQIPRDATSFGVSPNPR